MYLGSYHFRGDPDRLVGGYDRMMERFPPEMLLLHVCVRRPDGITIYDACPTAEVFRAFATSRELLAAVDGAGLPRPEVTEIGNVHAARTPEGAVA